MQEGRGARVEGNGSLRKANWNLQIYRARRKSADSRAHFSEPRSPRSRMLGTRGALETPPPKSDPTLLVVSSKTENLASPIIVYLFILRQSSSAASDEPRQREFEGENIPRVPRGLPLRGIAAVED